MMECGCAVRRASTPRNIVVLSLPDTIFTFTCSRHMGEARYGNVGYGRRPVSPAGIPLWESRDAGHGIHDSHGLQNPSCIPSLFTRTCLGLPSEPCCRWAATCLQSRLR